MVTKLERPIRRRIKDLVIELRPNGVVRIKRYGRGWKWRKTTLAAVLSTAVWSEQEEESKTPLLDHAAAFRLLER